MKQDEFQCGSLVKLLPILTTFVQNTKYSDVFRSQWLSFSTWLRRNSVSVYFGLRKRRHTFGNVWD